MSYDELNIRIERFDELFTKLMSTSSRLEKQELLDKFKSEYPAYTQDLTYIFETLAGKHPVGYTLHSVTSSGNDNMLLPAEKYTTIQSLIEFCMQSSKTYEIVDAVERNLGNAVLRFLAPIVNRKLKLGIGASQLSLDIIDTTPMLAKKFEGMEAPKTLLYVDEKLDGNRCIAKYDRDKETWVFLSRSGKPLRVWFDMSGLSKDCIYDGEIMSREQTQRSILRYDKIFSMLSCNKMHPDLDADDASSIEAQLEFNKLSGEVNSGKISTGLVYNTFDAIPINDKHLSYRARHCYLMSQQTSPDVRLLPLLTITDNLRILDTLLQKMTALGGEGIMLHNPDAPYQHKRTDALLKYKKIKTMDMLCDGTISGEGKYQGMVGSITCSLIKENGDKIYCNVGSGISDAERLLWTMMPEYIIGKIVTVAYHEITQRADFRGSNVYSLRFPRLVGVRNDKFTTSEY